MERKRGQTERPKEIKRESERRKRIGTGDEDSWRIEKREDGEDAGGDLRSCTKDLNRNPIDIDLENEARLRDDRKKEDKKWVDRGRFEGITMGRREGEESEHA